MRSVDEKLVVEVAGVGSGEQRTRDEEAIDAGGANATGDDPAYLCNGVAAGRDTATAVEAFDTMRRLMPKVCLSYFDADLDANFGNSISTSTSETKGLELSISVEILPGGTLRSLLE
jgi:hypothetical protein